MSVRFTGHMTSPTTLDLVHEPSGALIKATAPKDNGGDGSSFSPTDLAAAALGACGTMTMTLFAQRNNMDVQEVHFSVEKEMASAPRRLGVLRVTYDVRTTCDDKDYERLIGAAKTCPVRQSLSEKVEVIETFRRL